MKSLGRNEEKVGSISIPQEVFFTAGKDEQGKYRQWITLFDHLDDDEYDGDMGENDEEQPRVLFNFAISTEKKQAEGKSRGNSRDAGSSVVKEVSKTVVKEETRTRINNEETKAERSYEKTSKYDKYDNTSSSLPTE